jgi:hypothetical protein
MITKGVIQEYITDINYAVLGYRIYYIFTKHEEKSTKNNSNRRKMIIDIDYRSVNVDSLFLLLLLRIQYSFQVPFRLIHSLFYCIP